MEYDRSLDIYTYDGLITYSPNHVLLLSIIIVVVVVVVVTVNVTATAKVGVVGDETVESARESVDSSDQTDHVLSGWICSFTIHL